MPRHLTLELTEEQRQELLHGRDHAPEPYVRERCAALLMIAEGDFPAHIARARLYRVRDQETVSRWLKRYQHEGLAGLRVRPGRGRKPAFFPCRTRRRTRPHASAPSSPSRSASGRH